MVEAAVEAHLIAKSGAFHGIHDGVDPVRVVVNGLFAEHVLSRGQGLQRDGRVGIGGGADQHGVDGRVRQELPIILCDLRRALFLRPGGGLLREEGVRQGFEPHSVQRAQTLHVHPSDPARADDTQLKHTATSCYFAGTGQSRRLCCRGEPPQRQIFSALPQEAAPCVNSG